MEEHSAKTLSFADGATLADAPLDSQKGLDAQLTKAKVKANLFQKPRDSLKIGKYVLLGRVGAGGMGEIYAAYDEHLDRKVAIKLVNPTIERGQKNASDRLMREAQTLARLSHPNVVQVYEVGVCDGKVFLAMEFIRGMTLDAWLRKNISEPSKQWRLIVDTFLAAGRGLAAVHKAGLMHRDFKPTNVLVGNDGRVCVVDFGLARAEAEESYDLLPTLDEPGNPSVSQNSTVAMRLTVSGAIVGTPAYMSPEQLKGDPTDRRSDVFSFCAVLHEALYGRRPLRGTNLPSLLDAVISGETPMQPRDNGVPGWLWRVLERGLAREPEDRYASMDALLAALNRDPARRRRRWLTVAAFVGGGMLIGSAAVSSMTILDNACAAAAPADPVWNQDTKERVQRTFAATGMPFADATWQQVEARLDSYLAHWRAARVDACEQTHVHKTQTTYLLELQTMCLDQRKRQAHALIHAFERADASTVAKAIKEVDALPGMNICSNAEMLMRGVMPPENDIVREQVAKIRDRLAEARILEVAGHYTQGIDIASAQLPAAQFLGYAPIRAEVLFVAGRLRLQRRAGSDIARGREMLLEAVDLAEESRHDDLAVDIWNELAYRHDIYGSPSLRHVLARRGMAAAKRIDDRGARRVEALRNLGKVLYRQSKFEEAERHHRQALALAEESNASALLRAALLIHLANTLVEMGRHNEAQDMYERALTMRREELGDSHPDVASASYDYALLLCEVAQFARARELLADARRIWLSISGDDSEDIGAVHVALAFLESEAGDLDAALEHARRALRIHEHLLGPDHPDIAEPLKRLGDIYLRSEDYSEALAIWQRVLEIQQKAVGETNQEVGISKSYVGETLARLGRYEEALALCHEIEQTFASAGKVTPLLFALLHKVRGLAFLGQGHARRAALSLQEALRRFRDSDGFLLDHADTSWALAQALYEQAQGPNKRVRELVRDAKRIYRSLGKAGDLKLAALNRWSRKTRL